MDFRGNAGFIHLPALPAYYDIITIIGGIGVRMAEEREDEVG